jgi:hypothetical protein
MRRFGQILMLFVCLMPVGVYAQTDQAQQLTLEAIEADKKRIVALNMQLSEQEQQMFWPLYDEYQMALATTQEKTLHMLKEYAQHYRTLSNERARALLDAYFAIEEESLRLKRFYVKKFSEVLPMTRVARYFQIENKIEAITNASLARLIPLAK